MQISGNSASTIPNLYDSAKKPAAELRLEQSTFSGTREYRDLLEISPAGRQLAAGAIQDQPARYYGSAEINDALQSVLKGKDPEVERAVYTIIQDNLLPGGSVTDEEERAALLESGLSQARFISDRYLTKEEAGKFLAAINQIAAIAKTRDVDPETGEAAYRQPPTKPKGAPDDYVNPAELMKRFDPSGYEKFREELQNGGDWSKILVQFSMQVTEHPEWVKAYRAEIQQQDAALQNAKIDNRFSGANTANLDDYLADMNGKIQALASSGVQEALTRNLQNFARIVGGA
jgi:hypothetical protein